MLENKKKLNVELLYQKGFIRGFNRHEPEN